MRIDVVVMNLRSVHTRTHAPHPSTTNTHTHARTNKQTYTHIHAHTVTGAALFRTVDVEVLNLTSWW